MERKWLAWLKRTGFVGNPSTGIILIGLGVFGGITFFWPYLGLGFGAMLAFLGAAIFLLEGPQPFPQQDEPAPEEKDWLETVLSSPTTGVALVLIGGLFLLAYMWRWFALLAALVSVVTGFCSYKLSLREEEKEHKEIDG